MSQPGNDEFSQHLSDDEASNHEDVTPPDGAWTEHITSILQLVSKPWSGVLQPKADIGIFIGYAPTKKAFRIYNRRTRRIIETIHVDFDELTVMASEHSSSGPALHEITPNPPSSTPFVPPLRSDWDLLFQPMFDGSLNPPPYVNLQTPEVIAPIPEVVAPEHVVSTNAPSSTIVDQDAPSPSLGIEDGLDGKERGYQGW
ncbi:hypothetical protein Tco_0241196 [Tanacetum coccineum]